MKYISLATLSFGADGDIPPGTTVTVTKGDRNLKDGKIKQADIDGFVELGVLKELSAEHAEKKAEVEAEEQRAAEDRAAALAKTVAEKTPPEKTLPDPVVGSTKTSASGVTAPGAKKEA